LRRVMHRDWDAADVASDARHRTQHGCAVARDTNSRAVVVAPLDRDLLDRVTEPARDGDDLAVPREAVLVAVVEHGVPEVGRRDLRSALRIRDAGCDGE